MKTFVLALSTLALSISAFAQNNGKAVVPAATTAARPAQPASAPTLVSKTEFTAKVGQLDNEIAQGKMDMAKSTWLSVKSMMVSVINNTRMQLAKSTDKASVTKMSQNQRILYGEAFKLSQGDLTANRTALHDKLSQFANAITQ